MKRLTKTQQRIDALLKESNAILYETSDNDYCLIYEVNNNQINFEYSGDFQNQKEIAEKLTTLFNLSFGKEY